MTPIGSESTVMIIDVARARSTICIMLKCAHACIQVHAIAIDIAIMRAYT